MENKLEGKAWIATIETTNREARDKADEAYALAKLKNMTKLDIYLLGCDALLQNKLSKD